MYIYAYIYTYIYNYILKIVQDAVLGLFGATFRLLAENRSRRPVWGSLGPLSGSRPKIAPGGRSGAL